MVSVRDRLPGITDGMRKKKKKKTLTLVLKDILINKVGEIFSKYITI